LTIVAFPEGGVMSERRCGICGRLLPQRRTGKPGRASLYCSAACRQRAYRSRAGSARGEAVHELIADIERQVQSLTPQLPVEFYSDVTALSSSVGRLRRIARIARDAKQGPAARRAPQIVTPGPVTESTVTELPERSAADSPATMPALDEWTFAELVEPHRRELQVHCYRMVGSYDDSEDLVQETFLRAWRKRDGFEGRSTVRVWLYRIATNACIDFLRRTNRRPQRYEPVPGIDQGSAQPPAKIAWLQPYPDELLDEVASDGVQPDAAAVSRETMELVFLAAIQHLPARQRAVLILRDLLGWPAADTATLLGMSVASVNSALQRARPTLRAQLPERRAEWVATVSASRQEREVLDKYMAAAQRADLAAMAELLSEDVRLTMPPNPFWFIGRDAFLKFVMPSIDPASPTFFGHWRHLPTRANRLLAAAGYVQRPGTEVYRAQVLDVLRIEAGRIVEITSFEPHLFAAFGLPLTL
jgi:RNA polymerase sigma-70 factor (ECF subfamily)